MVPKRAGQTKTTTTTTLVPARCSAGLKSQSPNSGHNKAGRSDFRNQRFEPGTGKTRKMRKVPLTPEKGSEETLSSEETQEGCGGLGGENPAAFPEGAANFPAAVFLAGKCPNLGRDSMSCCRKIGEEFSSSVEICRTTFPERNFGQPQPSRVF